MEPKRKLDDIDKTLIKTLLKNSRTNFSEIAKQCKVSSLTIKNRYKRLEKEGVIKGSTLLLNLCHLGSNLEVIFLITVPDERVNDISKKLREILADKQNVFCQPVEFNERYNIVLSLPLKSQNEITKIRELIKQQHDIINIEMNIVSKCSIHPENLDLFSSGSCNF
jgi:DNA-binding Lrp family transcriptional regulator